MKTTLEYALLCAAAGATVWGSAGWIIAEIGSRFATINMILSAVIK